MEVLGATDPAAGQWPADPLVTARRGALTRASVSDWCGVRDLVDAAIFFGQGSENETRKVTKLPRCRPVAEPTEEEPSLPAHLLAARGTGGRTGARGLLRLADTPGR